MLISKFAILLSVIAVSLPGFFLKNKVQSHLSKKVAEATPDLEPLQVSLQGTSLKTMAFGFDSALASLIWVRLLQDAQHTRLKEDKISWEFSEVDAVTTLDPQFEAAYQFGSMYVSFFRRDKEGGKRILEKWVNKRPYYWKPNHMLGMHYFLELNDYKNAAPHILKASQLPGAPDYISSLGIGLLTQSGAEAYALKSAIELYSSAIKPEAKMRLARRIRGLRWKKQKDNWLTALSLFKKANPRRSPQHIKDLFVYYPQESDRQIASVLSTVRPPEELENLLNEVFRFKLTESKSSVESVDPRLEQEFKNLGVFLQEDT